MLVAFLVVGPKDLPRVARWLGRQVKKARTLVREVKEQTGWDDLEKEFKTVQKEVKGAAQEQAGIMDDLRQASEDVHNSLRDAETDAKKAVESALGSAEEKKEA